MSRRTKLIIAALFLVLLLAIPAVYVALTWHPPHPLRFHIAAYHPAGSPEAWAEYGKLELRVENTSKIPVLLWCPGFGRTRTPPGGTQLRVTGTSSPDITLPPNGTATLSCSVFFGDDTPPPTWEHEEVSYTWMSDMQLKYGDICGWIYDRAPEGPRKFIEFPSFFTDTAELIPAKP